MAVSEVSGERDKIARHIITVNVGVKMCKIPV